MGRICDGNGTVGRTGRRDGDGMEMGRIWDGYGMEMGRWDGMGDGTEMGRREGTGHEFRDEKEMERRWELDGTELGRRWTEMERRDGTGDGMGAERMIRGAERDGDGAKRGRDGIATEPGWRDGAEAQSVQPLRYRNMPCTYERALVPSQDSWKCIAQTQWLSNHTTPSFSKIGSVIEELL